MPTPEWIQSQRAARVAEANAQTTVSGQRVKPERPTHRTAIRILLALLTLALLISAAFAAHVVRIQAGSHPQLIVGTDQTGYVNVSGNGVVYARGEWTA